MDRESQELRTYSQSWPPGFFVGSVALETGARARRRDGLMLVALAVCGWCLGYGVTDWVCDENQRKLAAASAQRFDAIVQARTHAGAATIARAAVVTRPAGVAEAAGASQAVRAKASGSSAKSAHAEHAAAGTKSAPADALPPPAATRSAQAPRRAFAATSPRKCRKTAGRKLSSTDEPSPVVSPEEMNKVLTLAAASKKIFASVDESVPNAQPAAEVVVLQPSAVRLPNAEPAASVEDKAVAIEALYVEGGVPSKVVNRGVQRLLPQYDRCREFCDTVPQRMKLSTTIDEAGHGRQVTVEGLSRPGLRRCLEQATAHLVVPAPDTGTARARWIVRFAAR